MGYLGLSRRAVFDREEIERFSIERWGSDVAARYLRSMEQALELLKQNPDLLRDLPEISSHLKSNKGTGKFCPRRQIAPAHDTRNLPIRLAGGGFKLGGHTAIDANKSAPRCNLFVTRLPRLGVETDTFGFSTGTPCRVGRRRERACAHQRQIGVIWTRRSGRSGGIKRGALVSFRRTRCHLDIDYADDMMTL